MAKEAPKDMGKQESERLPTRAKAADLPSERETRARETARLRQVSAFKLQPHSLQPLSRHADDNVRELMKSIHSIGLQEPPLVRRLEDGSYVILAGHRRVRAWQLLALDRRVEEKMPVYILTNISDRDAIYIMAAEYFHRRDFSAVHTANVIGHAWRERRNELGREPTMRDMEDVIPWKRQSISDYLKIADALEDPRRRDLVHSMDKQKALLYEVLKADDIATQIEALKAFAEGGTAATRRVLNGGEAPGAEPVVRRDRKQGSDVIFRLRSGTAADAMRRQLEEAERLVEELRAKLEEGGGEAAA